MATPDMPVDDGVARAHDFTEKVWQKRIANKLKKLGFKDVEMEYHVKNGRVDIQTSMQSMEIDWENKWAESLGQSLYYAACTGCQAVAVLLIVTDNGKKHVENAKAVAKKNSPSVQIWVVDTRTHEFDMGGGRVVMLETE